jgi:hypothetical protein
MTFAAEDIAPIAIAVGFALARGDARCEAHANNAARLARLAQSAALPRLLATPRCEVATAVATAEFRAGGARRARGMARPA